MYGTGVKDVNGEWVVDKAGNIAQAGRPKVPEDTKNIGKSALEFIQDLDADMPDAGAEASSAQEQIGEAIRNPNKDEPLGP